MSQSMRGSMAETVFSTVIGFGINYTANIALLPHMWDPHRATATAFHLGVVFTVISVVRGLGVRRLFNHPRVADFIDRADNHYGNAASWLKTRFASAMSRALSASHKTTSRDTTTVTPIASPLDAATVNLPEEKALKTAPANPNEPESAAPWNCS